MNLIPRIAQGDMQALALLYREQRDRIFRLALSLLGDAQLAEDVMQETFLRIQQQAPSFRGGNESAWITSIARNLSYDTLRRRQRETTCLDEPASSGEFSRSRPSAACRLPAAPPPDTGSSFLFLDLLKGLSPEEKDLVCLRLLADLSWREIGHIVGKSAGACRKQYCRTLEKLREWTARSEAVSELRAKVQEKLPQKSRKDIII